MLVKSRGKTYATPTVGQMAGRRKTQDNRRTGGSKTSSDGYYSEGYSKRYVDKIKFESKNRDLFNNMKNFQTMQPNNHATCPKTADSDHPYTKTSNYRTIKVEDQNSDAYSKQKMETE